MASYTETLSAGSDAVIATGIVFMVLAAVSVILRFATKRINRKGLGADDWLLLVGLVFFCVESSMQIASEVFATRSQTFGDDNFLEYVKIGWTSGAFYGASAAAVKLCILIFYRYIFVTNRWFNVVSIIMIVVNIMWAIGITFSYIWHCRNPNSMWDPIGEPSYCFPLGTWLVGTLTSEIVIDTIILLLPIPNILQLQLRVERKVQISGIFLLGSLVVITNIVRLCLSYDPATKEEVYAVDELWLNVHMGCAILCASLPTYRPLLIWAKGYTSSFRSRYGYSSDKSSTWPTHGSSEASNRRFGPTSVDGKYPADTYQVHVGSMPSHHHNRSLDAY